MDSQKCQGGIEDVQGNRKQGLSIPVNLLTAHKFGPKGAPQLHHFPGGQGRQARLGALLLFHSGIPLLVTMGPELSRGLCPTGTKGADPRTEHLYFFFLQVLSGIPYLCTLAVYCCYVALTSTLDVHHAARCLQLAFRSNSVVWTSRSSAGAHAL